MAFPLQQWLHEPAKPLGLYAHCLSYFCVVQYIVHFRGQRPENFRYPCTTDDRRVSKGGNVSNTKMQRNRLVRIEGRTSCWNDCIYKYL
jgi:hypothetical protein